MKRWLMKMVAVCALLMTGQIVYAQDDDYYNQVASQEYKQWSFSPESYYYSWYKKKINLGLFSFTMKVPGLGVHDRGPGGIGWPGDNYVNERWRQMTPLRLATVAENLLQKKHIDDDREFWKTINIKDLAVFADKAIDIPIIGAKAVTNDDREEFSQQILDNIFAIRAIKDEQQQQNSGPHTDPSWAKEGDLLELPNRNSKYKKIADELRMEYDVIRQEISMVLDSHEPNSNKLRSLQECNNRLRKLRDKTKSTLKMLTAKEDPWFKDFARYNNKYRMGKKLANGSSGSIKEINNDDLLIIK